MQPEHKRQPFTVNITIVEGLGRFDDSHGLAPAPAEPVRVVAAAAARRFLDVLHVLWKKTSLSVLNFKSFALYHSIKECEWRIKITKVTDRHTWKWMEKPWNRDNLEDVFSCGRLVTWQPVWKKRIQNCAFIILLLLICFQMDHNIAINHTVNMLHSEFSVCPSTPTLNCCIIVGA